MATKTPYEVPAEMRDFAEKSVDQAKKAFDGFMGAAQKTIAQTTASGASAQTNVQDMTRKSMSYAENNVTAAFDLAQKLVRSKDLAEVMQHQAEFLKTQMASMQSQMKDIGVAVQDVAAKATKGK
jgi:phasin